MRIYMLGKRKMISSKELINIALFLALVIKVHGLPREG